MICWHRYDKTPWHRAPGKFYGRQVTVVTQRHLCVKCGKTKYTFDVMA